MSGHSKWHNIQAKKGKTDAARGKIFTKIGREIAVCVKMGGADPNVNSKLKDIIAPPTSSFVIFTTSRCFYYTSDSYHF